MTSDKSSILIVDDDEPIRRLLATHLGAKYQCTTAADGKEAAKLLLQNSFNLILTDITMPGSSGLDLCRRVQEICSDAVVVMVSGMSDISYAIEAMRQGAFDYVTKPIDFSQLELAVERGLRYQALLTLRRHYEQSLEDTVQTRTDELRLLNENLNNLLEILFNNYRATLRALAEALEARDVETRGHSDRVVAYCLRIGRELGLRQTDLIALEQGALLHDIGKIGVRDSLLLKPASLSEDERTEMRQHVRHGLRILDGIDFLSEARPVVGQHHEKYDGSGYPNGLCGEAIHINARIFAVADAYDAITNDRPYRARQTHAKACAELIACSGSHFDPNVVAAFLEIPEAELADMCRRANERDYDQLIDEHEIRSFIISLKRSGHAAPVSTYHA